MSSTDGCNGGGGGGSISRGVVCLPHRSAVRDPTEALVGREPGGNEFLRRSACNHCLLKYLFLPPARSPSKPGGETFSQIIGDQVSHLRAPVCV